jgi:hypothetical protein
LGLKRCIADLFLDREYGLKLGNKTWTLALMGSMHQST